MSLSFVNADSATGSTSLAVPYPSGIVSGDLLVLGIVNKYPSNGPSTPSGWTLHKQQSGGHGSSGASAGNVYTTVYTKTATGSESGTLSVTLTSATTSLGMMAIIRSTVPGFFGYDVNSAAVNTVSTSWSATTGSMDLLNGDMVVAFTGINSHLPAVTDTTVAVTAAGITFDSSPVDLWSTVLSDGQNAQINMTYHKVTAGSATVAPTYSATIVGSGTDYPAGSTVLLRVRGDLSGDAGAVPDVTVGVGFGGNPFDTTITYTDVSDYIDAKTGINIVRGRTDQLSQPSPGTCTFVLNNDDGRFTPGYTGGPYGSDVKVRAPVQVTIGYNGTDYTRFTGFVQSWELFWPGGVTESSKVQVTAVDLLGILADTPSRVPITDTMLHTEPAALYPLTERQRPAFDIGDYDQNPLRFMDRGGPAGTVDMGRRDGNFPSSRNMRTVYVKAGKVDADDRMAWAGLYADVDYQSASTYLGFGGWVKWDADSLDTNGYIASLDLNSTYSLLIWQHPDYGLCCGVNSDRATSPTIAVSGGQITDGKWHFVYALYEQSSYKMTLVVDGDTVGYSATGLTAPSGLMGSSGKLVIGGADFPATLPSYTAIPAGWLSHWGVWVDSVAYNLDVADIYTDGKANERPDSLSSQRVGWLLDKVGWPTANRNLEVGTVTVPSSGLDRSSALSYVQSCADAEVGVVYVKRDGKAAFDARGHRYATATASSGTLSWHEVGETWSTDVESVRNIIAVSFVGDGGGSVTVRNKASETSYGHRRQEVSGGLLNGHFAHGTGEYVLAQLATPQPRMTPFRWLLTTCPTVADNELVLGFDIGDRFTVDDIPTPAHTSTADFWIEQLAERISIDEWSVTVTTSPWVELFADGTCVLGSNTLDTDCYLSY